MAAYTVLATQLHQQTSAIWDHGMLRVETKKYRRGDTVTDLSDADIERHLASGAIAPKSSDEAKAAAEYPTTSAPVVAPVAPDVPTAGTVIADDFDDDAPLERPKQTASKADWEAYAESCGVDIEGLSKAELIEATK